MINPILELNDLSVAPAPGANAVIRHLDLSIGPGEIVAILGPNGVGKTTLIRTLAGILSPRSGQVTLDNRPVRDWRPRERAARMAVVFQNEVPQFDFSVRDITLQGRFHASGALGKESETDREAARDAMERMGLSHLADRATPRLSGGEWRRTLLARALTQGAPVLLLDEPTAGLDIGWSHRALRELCLSRRGQGAVIMALHDPNLAATFCSRILLFGPSALLTDGSAEEAFRPETLYRAYGTRPSVGVNPYTGKPHVFPSRFHGEETDS